MVLSDALSTIDKHEISYELFCCNATFELVDIRVGKNYYEEAFSTKHPHESAGYQAIQS